jgi:hypothetical protein
MISNWSFTSFFELVFIVASRGNKIVSNDVHCGVKLIFRADFALTERILANIGILPPL